MTVRIQKPAFNIREKLSELERPIGLKGSELMRAETAQEARDFVSAGRKNLIINGDMRIAQRGTSFTNLSTNQYTLDRFFIASATSDFTVSQESTTLLNGRSVNTIKFLCTNAATHWLDPYQGIENYKIISNQTVTFSAWVKTNHPSVNFRQYSTKNFGDTFIPDGQWHYYTTTTTLGSLTSLTKGNNSPYFGITNSANSSWTSGQYIEFTEFQIELGKNATEFEHRSYGEELALCQRYFWYAGNSLSYWTGRPTSGPTWKTQTINFPVAMRANPTVIEQTLSNTSPTSGWDAGYYPANGNGAAHSWGGNNWAQWFTVNGSLLTFQGVSANSATGAGAPSGTVATGDELQIINLSFSAEL